MTLTLGYKPVESLLLRTELRYDKADQDVFFSDSGDAGGGPDENHQTTIAFDPCSCSERIAIRAAGYPAARASRLEGGASS